MDALALLSEFVLKVVHSRQSARLQAWSNWIREDLTSHPYLWLRLEFVSPAPYLVCKPQDSPNGSGILVQPALIDAYFRKAWMPYFRREGHPVVSPQAFLDFVEDHFHRRPLWIWERSEMMMPWPRNPLLGDLMAGLAMRLKLSLHLGLSDSPLFFAKSKLLVDGLTDSSMRNIAMIPKAEGDGTPLGQRPPLCSAGCLSAVGLGPSGPSSGLVLLLGP